MARPRPALRLLASAAAAAAPAGCALAVARRCSRRSLRLLEGTAAPPRPALLRPAGFVSPPLHERAAADQGAARALAFLVPIPGCALTAVPVGRHIRARPLNALSSGLPPRHPVPLPFRAALRLPLPPRPPILPTMSDLGSDGADLGSGLSIPSLPSVSTPSGRSTHGVFGGGAKADAAPISGKRTMSGWLYKEGKRLRGRARRYLIATDEVLAQAPKEGASPSWTVARDDTHVYPGERPLELVVAAPRRTVSYFAEDTDELVRWLRALRNSQSVRVGGGRGSWERGRRGRERCGGGGATLSGPSGSEATGGVTMSVVGTGNYACSWRPVGVLPGDCGGGGGCRGVPLRWDHPLAMRAARLRGLLGMAACQTTLLHRTWVIISQLAVPLPPFHLRRCVACVLEVLNQTLGTETDACSPSALCGCACLCCAMAGVMTLPRTAGPHSCCLTFTSSSTKSAKARTARSFSATTSSPMSRAPSR